MMDIESVSQGEVTSSCCDRVPAEAVQSLSGADIFFPEELTVSDSSKQLPCLAGSFSSRGGCRGGCIGVSSGWWFFNSVQTIVILSGSAAHGWPSPSWPLRPRLQFPDNSGRGAKPFCINQVGCISFSVIEA